MENKNASSPSPVSIVSGDNQPRYTTKRLRDEIVKAKAQARRQALEDAAKTLEAHPGREFFTGKSGRIEWRLSSRSDFASAIRAMQSATATEGE
ncbi:MULTISPECIES: hypothetical protein [unclassified Rhizobium]|uniref:hypothetical protein n=1 Tax=unclassified Rhizobium TaxID=2613769 RepID=UPI001ADC32FB|nr:MULTISPECIES: hypothetical protein [unclassified Rhizobium]MBO9099457.1 hypothetical protein [Rhizobium sp. L58/93]QXZ87058.1 hypothetical protein J5287_20950 [Rhizobium sp. K1/93]QXZ92908.1 hypothetical protein J5280_19945 [Rhizobium sp. K15/93]